MATAFSQHIHHFGRHLGFFKKCFFAYSFTFNFNKNAAIFLEIGKKHVFRATNRNIIKNNVEKSGKEEIRTNFVKM